MPAPKPLTLALDVNDAEVLLLGLGTLKRVLQMAADGRHQTLNLDDREFFRLAAHLMTKGGTVGYEGRAARGELLFGQLTDFLKRTRPEVHNGD